jgi:hypothetical protein
MKIPGKPKFGVVSVGHESNHGGNARHTAAVVDDYPIKFGIRAGKPPLPKRRYYGENKTENKTESI